MLALPPASQPAPRRQTFVGTAVAGAAGLMLIGGMLATWLQFRADAPVRESMKRGFIKDWMPAKIVVPEVAANMILIGLFVICIMAQWAVYSAKRNDRTHTGLALGVTALLALASINAQIFIWTQMGVGARDGAFHSMFYAATGTMTALLLSGGIGMPNTMLALSMAAFISGMARSAALSRAELLISANVAEA